MKEEVDRGEEKEKNKDDRGRRKEYKKMRKRIEEK